MASRTKLTVLVGSVVLLTALLALGLTDVSAQSGVDLAIYKWSTPPAPGPAIAGEELFYRIEVRNQGAISATNVLVTDTLPYEVSYIDDTGDCNYNDVLHQLVCGLGNLEGYGYREFDVKVRVDPWAVMEELDGTIVLENSAAVGSSEEDDDPSNNTVTHSMFVEDSADLTVVKMSKPDTQVRAGQPFVYTIFVENLGPSFARNVAIRDEIVLEPGKTLTDLYAEPQNPEDGCLVIPADWGYSIECTKTTPLDVKDIELSGRWSVQVTLQADETQDVNNVVNVFSSDPDGTEGPGIPTPDPDLSNNTAEDFIYVTDVADLVIYKNLDWCDDGADGGCVAGGMASFGVTVVNNGPSTAENVVVEDLLPAGVTVVEVYGDGGCTTGIPGDPFAPLTCNLGNIPPGGLNEMRSFDVEVRIDPDYVDTELPFDSRPLENDAWVYSDIFDPDNSSNRAHVIVDVYTLSELAITKWGFPELAGVGDGVEYEIRVRNLGPSTADMVHFVDLLPSSVDYEDYFIEQGTGTCTYHENLPWPWWEEYRGVHCYVDEIPPDGIVMVHLLGTYNQNLWWAESVEEVCNIVPDDDIYEDNDYFGVNDPFDMPGWFADSYIEIPFENSPIWGQPEYFGWCPDERYVEADLSIQKTSEPMKLYPGEQKVYHIEVTNNGPTGAPEVTVTDTLPVSVTYEIDNANCDLVGQDPDVLECHLGNMMPGETKAFDVWALVSRDAPPGEITNEAQVSMGGVDGYYDPNPENNWAYATNLVLEPTVADLGIQKWGEEAPPEWFDGAPFGPEDCYRYYTPTMQLSGVVAGCPLRYTLAVTNTGPLLAENVVVEDALPASVAVEGVGPSQGSCTTGIPGDPSAPLTCNLGNIPRDGGATIEVFVRTDADLAWEPLENDAVVSSDIPDPDNGNNRSHVLIWVEPFSYLYPDKGGPAEIMAGEEIEYWINLSNNGPSTAHEVHLGDQLPEGVRLLSAEVMIGEGSCVPDSAMCSLGDMAPWEGQAVRVRGYVEPWVKAESIITNTVFVWAESPFYQPVPEQPITDTVETLVHSAADLSITKTADPYKVYAGEQVRYDVAVTNNGPAVAYSVTVTDTLDPGVEFEISTVGCASPVLGQLTCPLGDIKPGDTATFSIWARVKPDTLGIINNRVDVFSDSDPNSDNDWDTEANLVLGRADLRLQKFGKPEGEVRAGQSLIYTIIVDNLGTGYAHGVTLDDLMESNGSFNLVSVASNRLDFSCDKSPGTYGPELQFTCALTNPLEVKGPTPGSGRWMLTVTVQANQPQSINNRADVYSFGFDPDMSNNWDIAEHEITAVADLELTKEAWGEMLVGCEGETELWLNEVAAGGTVTYTLTVSNTGPSTAENVVVLDEPLPDLLEIDVQSITPSQGNCQTGHIVDLRRLSCNLGTILAGESASVTFVAHVPPSVADNTVLVNDAQAYSDMFDNNNGNDVVSSHTVVSRMADLGVEKRQEPEMTLPSLEVVYTIRVDNHGPSDAHGVLISDTLPFTPTTDVTVECCASDGGQCDVPCNVPTCPAGECPWPDVDFVAQADIPADEWVIYTVTAIPESVPCEPITNTAEVSLWYDDIIDPCPANNVAWTESDPFCNFDPLVLKQYAGPDSPP